MNDDTVKLVRIPAATWRVVVEALEDTRLSMVRFQCFECQYDHYDAVDSFFCPSCGKHALGSKHFSGPSQADGELVAAALELARKVSAE